jgi:hypothetical protein
MSQPPARSNERSLVLRRRGPQDDVPLELEPWDVILVLVVGVRRQFSALVQSQPIAISNSTTPRVHDASLVGHLSATKLHSKPTYVQWQPTERRKPRQRRLRWNRAKPSTFSNVPGILRRTFGARLSPGGVSGLCLDCRAPEHSS